MNLNELDIIQRTAQAKCGRHVVVTLDPLKTTNTKSILLRVETGDVTLPIVLEADSTLHDVCEVAEMLTEEILELDT